MNKDGIFKMRALSAVMLIIAAFCLFGASRTRAAEVTVLQVGDTYTIESDRTLGSDDFLSANWYSSDEDVLEIIGENYNREDCQIRAVGSSAGKVVRVYCEYEYVGVWPDVPGVYTGRLDYYFRVTADPPQAVSLPETAEITDASSITLTPTVEPEGSESACTWTSSDTTVAAVDSGGVVRGVSKGTAVITAETVNGLKASCTVTVKSSHACGDELEWSFEDGVLTISGAGGMYEYDGDTPWQECSEEIREIVVSEGVTSIGSYAFSYTAAEEVSLPESLEYIGREAFSGCNLTSIYIPSGVRVIEGDAFAAYSLQEINVSPDNSSFSSFDGVLFNKSMTALVRYPQGRKADGYAVGAFVKKIAHAAFYNTALKELYVPDSVAEIEYYGISTTGLTVYGTGGSAAQKAVEEYNSFLGEDKMYFAEEELPMVSVGIVSGKYGDTVKLPVVLSGNSGFANLNVEISYNPSLLRLVSAESVDFGALYTGGADMDSGVYNMSWDSAQNVAYNGVIGTLEFEIIGEDFFAVSPVGISFWHGIGGDYTDGIDVNFDENFNDINLRYMAGGVEVTPQTDLILPAGISQENGLSLTAELFSADTIDGVVIAAVYDENGLLLSVKLYDAAPSVDIEYGGDGGCEVALMWFYDMESLTPRCESARVPLGNVPKTPTV